MIHGVRELSRAEIDALLGEQVVGRVGCHADGLTYVVPVIFAWDGEAVYVFTVEGQKTRMLRENPSACFEVDVYEGPGVWRSAILQGEYEELDGDEAQHALGMLRARFPGGAQRPRSTGRDPVAFRIRVREATGRAIGG
jgi:nitroimidazol reductase NimA-like FMN-containing flavoprotein (pyridoxamine 5'-phosphate oxidase superfamily)